MPLTMHSQQQLRTLSEDIADAVDQLLAEWNEAGEDESEVIGSQAFLELWDELAEERGWNPAAARKLATGVYALCQSGVE